VCLVESGIELGWGAVEMPVVFATVAATSKLVTMPAKKKASAVDNLNARLSLVVKSGKISLGHRTTVKALRKSQGEPGRRGFFEDCCLWAVGGVLRGLVAVGGLRAVVAGRAAGLTCAWAVFCPCVLAAKLVLIAKNCPPVREPPAAARAAGPRSLPPDRCGNGTLAAHRATRFRLSQLRRSEIEYYSMLAKVNVVPYNGNNIDMGTAVGKFYRVSAMTIIDAGECAPCVLPVGASAVQCLWGEVRQGGRAGASLSGGAWGLRGQRCLPRAQASVYPVLRNTVPATNPRPLHVVRR
jgi:ribosomal protein L30E